MKPSKDAPLRGKWNWGIGVGPSRSGLVHPLPGANVIRPKEDLDTTDNPAVYDKRLKELKARCSYCHWHRGCNRRRPPKHTPKPKKNDHRRR